MSALLAISRNRFFKVVLSIFERTELTGAIIPTVAKTQRRKLLMVSVIIAAKLRATAITKVIVNSVVHMASAPDWRERGREVGCKQQTTQNRSF
jgi:hypothetical protein